jgi:arginyl-tRNA synthetase
VLELGETIELSVHHMEPHRIAFYALDLANLFHPVFDNVRVLHSEVPPEVAKARLRFFRAAQVVLKRALRLMGMSAPEVM